MEDTLLRFLVLSRREIAQPLLMVRSDGLRGDPPSNIVISITDPDGPEADIPPCPTTKAILRLQFWDIIDPSIYQTEPDKTKFARVFDDGDALRICKFVRKHMDEVDLIVCQCEAGISRSAGVASALARQINQDDAEFFRGKFHPNPRVRKFVNHVWRRLENAKDIFDACPECGWLATVTPLPPDEEKEGFAHLICAHCTHAFDKLVPDGEKNV